MIKAREAGASDRRIAAALQKGVYRGVPPTEMSNVSVGKILDGLGVARTGANRGGLPPFGWMLNAAGSIFPNLTEQTILGEMVELRREGSSWRQIAAAMKVSHPGRALSHTGVRRAVTAAETRIAADDAAVKGINKVDPTDASGKEACNLRARSGRS